MQPVSIHRVNIFQEVHWINSNKFEEIMIHKIDIPWAEKEAKFTE